MIKAFPSSALNEDKCLLEVSDFEFQLILLSVSRMLQDSQANTGAQTRPLAELESSLRNLFHEWNRLKSFQHLAPRRFEQFLFELQQQDQGGQQ
uniref:hypothetical protein n=1 Tax=Trichocoleus desertorum TaxID=1481672 RepID=UPI0025B39818|nr:hypothetical protein [Trichocoleus desertorum]